MGLGKFINSGGWIANFTNVSGSSVNYTITQLVDGDYVWSCLACDNVSQCSFASSNHSFSVDTSTLRISVDYSHWWVNSSTNVSLYSLNQSISDFTLINFHGGFSWLFNVSFGSTKNLSNHLRATQNVVFVNESFLPELNTSKCVVMRNITYVHPIIKKDGADCTTCQNVTYNTTTKELEFVD